MLVANHAGQLPFDGAMLGVAMLLEAEPPRLMRAMGEYWIPQLPFMSVAAARSGALVGTPASGLQRSRPRGAARTDWRELTGAGGAG